MIKVKYSLWRQKQIVFESYRILFTRTKKNCALPLYMPLFEKKKRKHTVVQIKQNVSWILILKINFDFACLMVYNCSIASFIVIVRASWKSSKLVIVCVSCLIVRVSCVIVRVSKLCASFVKNNVATMVCVYNRKKHI